ncbi:hypothetical protein JRC04_08880 [Mycolicibacterium sp. S2-37]|uniref:hypothetical protein n=1 Tax=Mycolicibacterium sp. S2-37 TaxID=2810297 RepID=UPI001A93CD9A|nr:hypothetical protein [Mycolicibacterium sp. S2-37]MBO0677573.1 hypothetical protein [Mycolicibacterium sp. S2-37]
MTSPQPPAVTVHALGTVCVPVGHRVEVRVFLRDNGKGTAAPCADEPFITDLDTGVTFGTDWHFRRLSGYRPGTIQDLPVMPAADLAVHSVLVGTVAATRVVTIGGGDSLFHQTTLLIEPSGDDSHA